MAQWNTRNSRSGDALHCLVKRLVVDLPVGFRRQLHVAVPHHELREGDRDAIGLQPQCERVTQGMKRQHSPSPRSLGHRLDAGGAGVGLDHGCRVRVPRAGKEPVLRSKNRDKSKQVVGDDIRHGLPGGLFALGATGGDVDEHPALRVPFHPASRQ
nr:hypothetical protein [Zavarzinella formosa]